MRTLNAKGWAVVAGLSLLVFLLGMLVAPKPASNEPDITAELASIDQRLRRMDRSKDADDLRRMGDACADTECYLETLDERLTRWHANLADDERPKRVTADYSAFEEPELPRENVESYLNILMFRPRVLHGDERRWARYSCQSGPNFSTCGGRVEEYYKACDPVLAKSGGLIRWFASESQEACVVRLLADRYSCTVADELPFSAVEDANYVYRGKIGRARNCDDPRHPDAIAPDGFGDCNEPPSWAREGNHHQRCVEIMQDAWRSGDDFPVWDWDGKRDSEEWKAEPGPYYREVLAGNAPSIVLDPA